MRTREGHAPSFEWETGQGFKRYKHAAQITGRGKVKLSIHWTTSDETRGEMVEGYSVTDEMFSSFLNFHIEIQRFYSAYKEDVHLGAAHDGYSDKMTELSIYANPENERGELYKAF